MSSKKLYLFYFILTTNFHASSDPKLGTRLSRSNAGYGCGSTKVTHRYTRGNTCGGRSSPPSIVWDAICGIDDKKPLRAGGQSRSDTSERRYRWRWMKTVCRAVVGGDSPSALADISVDGSWVSVGWGNKGFFESSQGIGAVRRSETTTKC